MALKLNRFDPTVLEEKRKTYGPPTCVILGRRGCGKSTLVSDLLYYCRKVSAGVVMSGTEDGNSFYSKYVPDLFVHSEYNPETIKQLIARQKLLGAKVSDKTDSASKTGMDTFLLLDDLMYDKRMVKDKNIRCIFMNGRWLRIMCFLTAQYAMDIPPDIRGNIDYLFILKENIVENQKKLYKHYFGMFQTFEAFRTVLMQCTDGHDCLVLDNTCRSNKIEDAVFWYCATPNREFKIGSPALWNYHKSHYNPKHEIQNLGLTEKPKVGINVTKIEKKPKLPKKETETNGGSNVKTTGNIQSIKKTQKSIQTKKPTNIKRNS